MAISINKVVPLKANEKSRDGKHLSNSTFDSLCRLNDGIINHIERYTDTFLLLKKQNPQHPPL